MNKRLREFKVRVIWLTIGLGGSLLIAGTITRFEEVLKENIILASFIPLVVYISDAVGTQMESIIIREFNKRKEFNFLDFFKDQLIITLMVGLTLSIISYFTIILFFGGSLLGITISLGLLGGVLSAILTGTFVPYFFWKFHQDPAEASGPIATVMQDFLSVLIFFTFATLLL